MENNSDGKLKAGIKLGIWLIFIIVLVVIAQMGDTNNSNNNNNSEVKEEIPLTITYEEKLNKLVDNFKYHYEIQLNNTLYEFSGSKKADQESGYKKEGESYRYYYLDNGYVYDVVDGALTLTDNLYEGMDINYLNLTYVKDLIKNVEVKIEDNKYTYELPDKIITITVDDEFVNSIEIKIDENNYYKLTYSDISLIKEIVY